MSITPICCPSAPTRRTWEDLILSLIRGSVETPHHLLDERAPAAPTRRRCMTNTRASRPRSIRARHRPASTAPGRAVRSRSAISRAAVGGLPALVPVGPPARASAWARSSVARTSKMHRDARSPGSPRRPRAPPRSRPGRSARSRRGSPHRGRSPRRIARSSRAAPRRAGSRRRPGPRPRRRLRRRPRAGRAPRVAPSTSLSVTCPLNRAATIGDPARRRPSGSPRSSVTRRLPGPPGGGPASRPSSGGTPRSAAVGSVCSGTRSTIESP